jgi:hypothetical protein
MARKILVHISIDREIMELILNMRARGLRDGDLHYFKFAMGTKGSWYNYVLQMGCNKIKEDWDKWKEMRGVKKDDGDS